MMPNINRKNIYGQWAGVFSAIVLSLLLSTPSNAQQVWSLDSILSKIRHNNPMLQGYAYKIDALNAYAEGAKSWMPPMFGVGTYMAPYPGQEMMGNDDKGMLMLVAEQSIPNQAKLKAKENFMQSKSAVEHAALGNTFNQLRAKAKGLYYQWLVLEKKKTVLDENREIMQTLLKLAEIRYPLGQGSLGSIYKAKGRLHEVENMLLMNKSNIIQKNIILNALMNIPRNTHYKIDTSLKDFGRVLKAVDSTYLLQHRSDLQKMERSIASMRLGLELEKMERKPDFSIRFEHMQPYGGMMPAQYSLMGMISIPIAPWSSKMYKANTKGMRLEIQAMEKEQESMLNQASGIINGMAWSIKTMRQQLANYKEKIIPALQKNYETNLLAYEQNQEELPMVIDAWEAKNMAQMEYLNKLEDYYLMAVSYEAELEVGN